MKTINYTVDKCYEEKTTESDENTQQEENI